MAFVLRADHTVPGSWSCTSWGVTVATSSFHLSLMEKQQVLPVCMPQPRWPAVVQELCSQQSRRSSGGRRSHQLESLPVAVREKRTQDDVTLEIHTQMTGICHFCLLLIALKEALAQQPLGAGGHTSLMSRAGIQKYVAVGTGDFHRRARLSAGDVTLCPSLC